MPVKNKLKEIRMREHMLSQKDFSALLETDVKTYSNWEKNISRPPLEKALEVSRKLKRTVNDIWYLG